MSLATLSRPPSVSDERLYRLLYAATFPFFLLAAAVQRTRRTPHPEAPRSLLAEARATGANALLYAFQG